MLQTTKDQPAVQHEQAIALPEETLELFVSFIRRQFPVIVFVTLLGMALGVVYLITTPPSYTAQAALIIDSRKVNLFQQQSVLGDIPIDTASVESQVEVLKSENVALSVIKDLHLAQDPEFIAPSGGLIGTVIGFISNPFESSEPASEFALARKAMRVFQDHLSVKRVGLSYVIDIAFRSLQPERAAQITNAVADAYIVDQLEAKYQATKRASVWLQARIRELRDQASAAERAVVEFKTKNNIVTTGGPEPHGRLMGEQQVAELSSQIVIARAQSAEARARLDRIETVLRADSPEATVNSTVADSLKNEVITKLRTQYLDIANKEAIWSARYGANHLAAVNLRNQMDEIRKSILNELQRIAESYKSDYQIAKQREEGIHKELSDAISRSQETDQAQVTLHELESNSQTYRSLYDNFLQHYMESVQQQSFPITDARVISPASRPLQKSNPKTLIVLAVSGLGAMILGFGIGMLRDLSDRVFRASEQVERLLQTGCIALVPLLERDAPTA
jgi:succinoglycan biosynthesis transport protein ExoP